MAASGLPLILALVLRPLAVPLLSLRAASRVWQRISGDPAPDAALILQSLDSAREEQQACLADSVDNVCARASQYFAHCTHQGLSVGSSFAY